MSEEPTVVPVGLLHTVVGTTLVGTWVNTALFAFELTQVWRYFVRHPLWSSRRATYTSDIASRRRPDRTWIQIMVLWMLMLDCLASGAAWALSYGYSVTGWGNITKLQSNAATMTIYNISNALCVLTMHLFLIYRYYTLSQHTVFSIILALLALALPVLVTTISTSIITVNTHLADRAKLQTLVVAGLIDSAATDWLIASALMWLLIKIRTAVSDSQGVITRLIRISFLSGCGPALLALCCLIAFLCSPTTNFSLMFSVLFGRAATLTVLYNLNSRSTLANATNETSEATVNVDTTVDPGQLFGRPADSWSPGLQGGTFPMRPARAARWSGAGNVARAAGETTSLGDLDTDSKAPTDLELGAGKRQSRASIVRVNFTTSAPSRLEAASDARSSTWPKDADATAEL